MAQSSMQFTFNGGEWSPLMYGRYDLPGYRSSVAKMENMIALPQGPVVRRPGTIFVCNPLREGHVRIVPYEPNIGESYVVELGHQYVRILNKDGPLNHSGVAIWIEAPWTSEEVADVRYTQCGDRLYFWHHNHPPTYLIRSSTYIWRFDQLAFTDGPWLGINTSATSVTCNANHGWAEVSSSADLFSDQDVGRHIRIGHGNNWGWGTITEYYEANRVQILIRSRIHDTNATQLWRLGAWSRQTGYPSCGAFIEDRLFAAATKSQPRTIWASKTAKHADFSPTNKNNGGLDDRVEADSAITITLSDERVQQIKWLQAGTNLVAGTTSGEFMLRSSNGPITPFSISARRETTRGVAACTPERLDNSLLYVARGGKQLHEMLWDYSSNSWLSPDLSLLSGHLLQQEIKEIAMQQLPWNILWMRRQDGHLIGMTWMKDRNINAWHRHSMGGGGYVENIITVTGEREDVLWLVVRRKNKRSIEYMANIEAVDNEGQNIIHYVDCGLTYSGKTRLQQDGLQYLEGENLQVLADHQLHKDCQVHNGHITLDREAKTITAGFKIDAKIECLEGIFSNHFGDVYRQKNLQSIELQLLNSSEISVDYGGSIHHIARQKQLPYRFSSDQDNKRVFSGLFQFYLKGSWSQQPQLTLMQQTALPFNLISLHAVYS